MERFALAVRAESVLLTKYDLIIDLNDGRSLSVPLAWFPRLQHGTPDERTNWRWIGDREGIQWP